MDEEAGDQVDHQDLGLGIGAGGDDFDQGDGEEDGDRIVGAGLDLERRPHPVAQLQIPRAQQEEDRGSVGRCDCGAKQERFQPAETGQVAGGHAEQSGGDDDADGRERKRRHGGLAECRERRAESGFEQDDGQRQCADEISKTRIVELDAEAVDAGHQTEAEKEEQQGRAEAEGDQARKRRGEHERSADQRYEINRLIHSAVASRLYSRLNAE